MLMAYPVTLTRYDDGSMGVQFPDVPEAITLIASLDQLQEIAGDALVVALSGYLDGDRRIPPPRAAKKGQPVVYLSMLVGAKLAIHDAMVAQGWSRLDLARQLGKDEKIVRRLLNLDHASTFGQVEDALKVLNKAAAVSIRDRVTA